MLLIGHDMGLMAQVVDRVGIMYAGKFAEVSQGRRSLPRAAASLQPAADRQPAVAGEQGRRSRGFPGLPPSLLNRPDGCAFRSRCPQAFDRCVIEEPPLREVQPGRQVACHLY